MRVLFGSILLLAAGCESVEPSGDVMEPVRPVEAEPAPAPTPAPEEAEPDDDAAADAEGADEGYDFEADLRPEGDTGDLAEDRTPEEIAAGLGVEPGDVEDEPTEQPGPEVDGLLPRPKPMPPSAWAPGSDLDGSWGVRLVSTVVGAQPPRAILGLPDGSEQVVQPGTLLPDQGLVVMAVGRDVVQVAEIIPRGDHVRVETRQLDAMYGSAPPTTPR